MPQSSVRVATGLNSLSQGLALKADRVRNHICPKCKGNGIDNH